MRMIPRGRTLVRLSLILLTVQSASCIWQPNNPEKEALCDSPTCVARGNEYENNLDARADPCEDFYTFTCGNWRKNHRGPKYDSQWTVVDVMYWKLVSIIKKTFETHPTPPAKISLIKQAKKVYETCLRIPEYPIKKAGDIHQEIMKIGRYPTVPLWVLHNAYLKLSGESPFFAIEVMASTPKEGNAVVMLTEPAGAFGAIFHGENWKPQEEKNYIDFLLRIMNSLNLNDRQLKEKIIEVFKFRKNLYKVITKSKEMEPSEFKPLTKKELDQWFTSESRRMTTSQQIPWTTIVDAVLENLDLETEPKQKVVAIRRKGYFHDLMNFLKDVPKDVLANHIEIYFVERHLQWDKSMFELLEGTSIEPHAYLSYIKRRYSKRWELCIDKHNMKDTIETMLYETWFPKETINTVKEMIVKIKAEIDGQMMRSNWMNQRTREKTTKRINKLEQWIGFPKWFYEGGSRGNTHRRDNTQRILTPNASLFIVKNLLYIQAALLMSPIFDLEIPALYNYGGLGATIGHELYHIMDNCGTHTINRVEFPWWSDEMQEECELRMEKFILVFNNITDRDFKNRYDLNVESDTWKTLRENFPDVMGLEAAYNAYHQLASENPRVCRVLPGFEEYSCDQMFYIAFGNGYCGTYTKKGALDTLQTSKHSIESVRVNGAVAQMESFGRAFRCPVGSLMNPEDKLNMMQ